MGRNGKEEHNYTQPSLEGLAAPEPEERLFENCLVLSRPIYQDTGKKKEWTVTVHAQPSIFQPDTDVELLASAQSELASLSQRKSLKPGDRVVLTGILRVDTLTFPTGETQTVNRLALTQVPQMIVKEKRVSTTVYEQRKRR